MAATETAGRVVRKSAYGRTDLFLAHAPVLFREIRCMGGVQRRDAANVYHVLDSASAATSCCWHCCEPIHGTAYPIPRVYDATEQKYYVYGATCRPACAKAYIMEHTTFNRGEYMNVFTKMMRDVYGITTPIHETPPRAALQRFGGAFDPTAAPRAGSVLLEPPFISYCMVLEEHARGNNAQHQQQQLFATALPNIEDSEMIEEPELESAFASYMEARQSGRHVGREEGPSGAEMAAAASAAGPLPPSKARAKRAADDAGGRGASRKGPMAKWFRKPSDSNGD